MDQRTADRRLTERGVTSVQFLLGSVLALVFFVAVVNLMVVQYVRGSLRSALDQGVRAGSVHQSESVCRERIGEVLEDLLAGEIGGEVNASCQIVGGLVVAQVDVVVDSWSSLTGEFAIDLEARAVVEPNSP
ncbi:MAG: pilus assembly protein TadG-related protein [Acidimicrobiia bacterium]|nr:pilus assembly protein TadG-related protein [Acidimicrobiia bacterium]